MTTTRNAGLLTARQLHRLAARFGPAELNVDAECCSSTPEAAVRRYKRRRVREAGPGGWRGDFVCVARQAHGLYYCWAAELWPELLAALAVGTLDGGRVRVLQL